MSDFRVEERSPVSRRAGCRTLVVEVDSPGTRKSSLKVRKQGSSGAPQRCLSFSKGKSSHRKSENMDNEPHMFPKEKLNYVAQFHTANKGPKTTMRAALSDIINNQGL